MDVEWTKRLAAFSAALLLILGALSGCGKKEEAPGVDGAASGDSSEYRPSPVNYVPPSNGYVPPENEEGYIVVTMPISIIEISGATASELAEDFHSAEPPDGRITDIAANEDGSADYLFTLEQFERFKKDTYDSGCYAYGTGTFPESIKTVEYTNIDEDGIPWAAVATIDRELYAKSQIDELLGYTYGVAWPANYIGQYQIFCGIPGDEWSAHVILKDADTGEVLLESDFPT